MAADEKAPKSNEKVEEEIELKGSGIWALMSALGGGIGGYLGTRPAFVPCVDCECRVAHLDAVWCIRRPKVENLDERNHYLPSERRGCYDGVRIVPPMTKEEFDKELADDENDPDLAMPPSMAQDEEAR